MTGVPQSLENTKWDENISEGAIFSLNIGNVPLPSVTSQAHLWLSKLGVDTSI